MEAAFFDVVSEVRMLQLTNSQDFKKLKSYLKRFERTCNKNKDANYLLVAFQNLHYDEMNKIVFFLRAQKDHELRGFHDRVFKNVFRIGNRVPRHVTRVFDDFVKGITYFEFENPAQQPIYHRLHACGNGTDPFRQQYHQCKKSMFEFDGKIKTQSCVGVAAQRHNRKTKKDVQTRITKCYLERMIYDRLYRDLELTFDKEPEQDGGHLHRMQLTKEDFESCFPKTRFDIDIEYDNMLPYKLTIVRYVKDKEVSREVYVKRIVFDKVFGGKMYYEVVECYKHVGNRTYKRLQGFGARPKRWVTLS